MRISAPLRSPRLLRRARRDRRRAGRSRTRATPTADKPFRIDTHRSSVVAGFIAEISGRGPADPADAMDAGEVLDDMDKGGVATSIVRSAEPGVFFGNYDAARALARECNEYGAKLVADHPGRFGLFAIVPLPDVDGTCRNRLRARHAQGRRHLHDHRATAINSSAIRRSRR